LTSPTSIPRKRKSTYSRSLLLLLLRATMSQLHHHQLF
jgi:hypothetical protein